MKKAISFYPGPSRVDHRIPMYVRDAYDNGILSINHRSETFVKMYSQTVDLLKEKLDIPEEYSVFFTSSATECWEIISQSLIHTNSYHFYNGAFGKKWFEYTKKLKPYAIGYEFDLEQELKTGELDLSSEEGVICITQNETSNGTHVDNGRIGKLRKKYPKHLIAVDATSSMAGIHLDFSQADVWYASVQKCFGLPAGLGVLICSPTAIDTAKKLNENKHYNSLSFMIDMEAVRQTTYTPNVLGIYLLMRVLKRRKHIEKVEKKLHKRLKMYEEIFSEDERFSFLVKNKKVRSETVVVVKGSKEDIISVKEKASEAGLILGNGYGPYKETTFRIANFPALEKQEVKKLLKFFKKYFQPEKQE
ncbi:Phosphoserine aminotransferase [Fulvivirga imtechensis AK7]|uniref:phosphoserine transaminase n=1 Tax=Fulvivirga imtechensis AK7 TaxID=1237149 RepID=L8JSS7_9BACT|nr:aminotransferase class V-fold PLP-dependent enzyme [Fulvivirga imtechensis]ELR70417.1 Phosphoserine aminotransferase [Fulvivirga imtechensis AK7]